MIKLTTKAAEQVRSVIQSRSMPDNTMLRVDIEPASDKGNAKLALTLDPNGPRPDDMVETTEGTRLAAHKSLAGALGNGQLDFRDEAGFVLHRPQPGTEQTK